MRLASDGLGTSSLGSQRTVMVPCTLAHKASAKGLRPCLGPIKVQHLLTSWLGTSAVAPQERVNALINHESRIRDSRFTIVSKTFYFSCSSVLLECAAEPRVEV